MEQHIGAVITGGDFQALGVVRTLGRKGIPVVVLDSDHGICKYSRYKTRFIRSPKLSDEEEYVRFLTDLSDQKGLNGWVLFPNSDNAVSVLSKNKEMLEKYYKVATPSWDVIKNVYIKKNTYKVAEEHGIPIAKTYYCKSLEELLDSELVYPLVIKPSIRDNFYNKVKIKAYKINDIDELINVYKYVSTIIKEDEIVVQEFIPGGPKNLYSFCSFYKEGKSFGHIMGRRARQHPMDFGHASTYAELVDIPEMKMLAEKFLNVIDYNGIAEVEFMQDQRNGTYKMIEVNPRVWGWHSLSTAAGVDIPYLQYQDKLGHEIDVIENTITKLKWVRLTTDCPTVFVEVVNGRMSIIDYLKSMIGKKEFAVFSWSDPLPFWAELFMIPYLWKKRGF